MSRLALAGECFTSRSILNAGEGRFGAEEQRLARDGRRRDESAIEFVFRKHFELTARLENGALTLFVAEVEPALGTDRRRGIIPGAGETFAPDFLAGLRVEARGDASILVEHEEQPPHEHRRRAVRDVACRLPHDVRVGHDAAAAGLDRPHLALGEAGVREDQPVTIYRPYSAGVVLALLDAPEFLAGRGVVAIRRFRARADQQRLSLVLDHQWR